MQSSNINPTFNDNDWIGAYENKSEFLPNPGGIDFGMNIGGINDWGREWPFTNLMKFCRPWLTGNDHWVSEGENLWDTGLINQIPCDKDGYPLELPLDFGLEAPQIVHTCFAYLYNLPLGEYIFLYDGEGEFEFEGNWDVINYTPGWYLLNLTNNNAFLGIRIQSSVSGNHARNFRLIQSEYESTYIDNPFNPAWLEKLSNFDTIRFMDWGKTNFHDNLSNWENRSHISEYCYSHDRGVPYEVIIELCNLLDKNAWVCVPHEASDDYISQMAQLFYDELEPELTLYVEYSNEIWNWMFPSADYCYDNGNQSIPWPERTAPFIQNALDIFTSTFSGNLTRLKRVVGVQAGWFDVGNRTFSNIAPDSYDIISPAAYFGFNETAIETLSQTAEDTTIEEVFNLALDGIKYNIIPAIAQYLNRTIELDKELMFYEAGQHLTPDPFGSVQPYGQALVDIQYHSAIYYLYNYLFNKIRELRDEMEYENNFLMMIFSFASGPSIQYGTWGVLPDIFLEAPYMPEAPKYQSILDNLI
ncbi:MAG: hypothetical protein ACFFDH_01285 [Promethearchaeota archaeon]